MTIFITGSVVVFILVLMILSKEFREIRLALTLLAVVAMGASIFYSGSTNNRIMETDMASEPAAEAVADSAALESLDSAFIEKIDPNQEIWQAEQAAPERK